MDNLLDLECNSAASNADLIDQRQIAELSSAINPDWRFMSESPSIRRDFKFQNFGQTMGFANAVAAVAESQNHHPDMQISYAHCVVTFTTHSCQGLSLKDFICAAKIDALFD